jgi:hypothetical protein
VQRFLCYGSFSFTSVKSTETISLRNSHRNGLGGPGCAPQSASISFSPNSQNNYHSILVEVSIDGFLKREGQVRVSSLFSENVTLLLKTLSNEREMVCLNNSSFYLRKTHTLGISTSYSVLLDVPNAHLSASARWLFPVLVGESTPLCESPHFKGGEKNSHNKLPFSWKRR